jgi:hypothetical protein
MRKFTLIICVLLATFLFITSCKKEEAAPSQHQQMVNAISAAKWKIVSSEQVLPNGNQPKDIDECRKDNIWEYKSDGSFALYVGNNLCSQNEKTLYGTWSLSSDNKSITYTIDGLGSYTDEVVEISSGQVVFRYTTDNVFTETYMPL